MLAIVAVVAVALIIGALLLLVGRMPAASRIPIAATIMFGISAWLVAGQPEVPGAPVAQPENEGFGDVLRDPRQGMTERFGPAAQWLGLSDAMLRRGRTADAAEVLSQGLRRHPRSVDLWVGYGNALVAHANGIMTPAAAMAFDRAAAIDPRHPAPPFFAGLAMAQSGNADGARALWSDLLRRSSNDAPYRRDLEARLAQLPPPVDAPPEPETGR